MEAKASAVRKAEEGATDLKKRVEELSKNLDEYENDYQVCSFTFCVICKWH